MNEKIDDGNILEAKTFKINKKDNIEKILSKTYKIMFKQAKNIINLLLKDSENVNRLVKQNKFKWGKKLTNSKELFEFYEIKKNDSKSKFNKKLISTTFKEFKPYIKFHGKLFFLE